MDLTAEVQLRVDCLAHRHRKVFNLEVHLKLHLCSKYGLKKAQNINNERRTKKNQISWSEKSKFAKMKYDFDFGF